MCFAQAQLRGMIGDAKGNDETALAQALESFDILSNSKEEYLAGIKGEPTSAGPAASQPATLQPPASSNPFQVSGLY